MDSHLHQKTIKNHQFLIVLGIDMEKICRIDMKNILVWIFLILVFELGEAIWKKYVYFTLDFWKICCIFSILVLASGRAAPVCEGGPVWVCVGRT